MGTTRDSRQYLTPESFLLVATATAIIVPCLVLIGWAFDVEFLKSVHTSWASMKPNTALCFLLLSIGVWILERDFATKNNFASKICSSTVILVGLLTLFEYIFKLDLRIDQFLFREASGAAGTSDPGRMGPNAAFNFVVLGLSLFLMSYRDPRHRKWIQALAMSALMVSTLSLVGYFYGVNSLYGISNFTKMAFHTTLVFFLLSIAQLVRLKDYGIMQPFMSDTAGGVMIRRLLPVAVLAPIIIAKICISFISHGYLNLETLAAFGATPIAFIFATAVWLNAKLLDQLDHDKYKVELELKQKQLELRYTLSNAIDHFLVKAPETSKAIPKILEIACKHLKWNYAAFWSIDKRMNQLRYEACWADPSKDVSEFEEATKKTIFTPGVGLPGRVWSSGQPLWIPDVTQDTNFPRSSKASRAGLRGAFGFPIAVGSEVMGIIEVFSSKIEEPDKPLLSNCQTLGIHIGTFIQRRHMEEKLKQSSDRLREAQQLAHVGNIEINTVTGESYWSEEIFRILELDPKEHAAGIDLYMSLLHPDERDRVKSETEKGIREGTPFGGDRKIITKEGKLKYIFSRLVPERDEKGKVVLIRGIVLDITDRKKAELGIAQKFKMTALGEMAGGIAHEINTPLAIVSMKASHLRELISTENFDKQKAISWTEKIEATAYRIAKIIAGLRTFAKDAELDPFLQENLKNIIDETVVLCGERFKGHGIDLKVDIPGEITLECRKSQICQIVLNLLNNSLDAIHHLKDKWIRITAVEKDDLIELVITDSGHGINSEIRDKIMQPFFTTKELGKGMGLGLSISKGIVENHRGKIDLDTATVNTRFVVTLPRRQSHKAAA